MSKTLLYLSPKVKVSARSYKLFLKSMQKVSEKNKPMKGRKCSPKQIQFMCDNDSYKIWL